MFTRFVAHLAIVLALFSSSASANLATTATVYFKGDPGSYVAGAVGAPEATWVHGVDGIFSATTNFDKGISVTYNDGNFWTFDFAAPTYDPVTNTNDGQFLAIGFYDKATRFPFNSPTKPGLDISGNGRGDNQLSGWFRVLDVAYGTNGDIDRFAVDFRQYDENLTLSGPSLYGSLRFNSKIPLTPVPEPTTTALFLTALTAVYVWRRKKDAKPTVV